MAQPAAIATRAAGVLAELSLEHHQRTAVLEHLGRDAGHPRWKGGARNAVQAAPRAGAAAHKRKEREAVSIWADAVDVGAPETGHALGHRSLSDDRSKRAQHHPWQEMAEQVARGNRDRALAVEHTASARSRLPRA